MNISEPTHKAILLSLFYNGSQERRFPLAVLPTAIECLRKLKEGSTTTVNGGQTDIHLIPGDVEFSAQEAALLGDLIEGLTEATPTEYQLIQEVRGLLAPKLREVPSSN